MYTCFYINFVGKNKHFTSRIWFLDMAIKSTNQFRDDSTWVWWTHLRFFGNIFGINRITFDFPSWTLVVSIHILPKYCIIASIYERCFLNAHFLYLLRPWKLMICIFILCYLIRNMGLTLDLKYILKSIAMNTSWEFASFRFWKCAMRKISISRNARYFSN